jgi:hypothetical protein
MKVLDQWYDFFSKVRFPLAIAVDCADCASRRGTMLLAKLCSKAGWYIEPKK